MKRLATLAIASLGLGGCVIAGEPSCGQPVRIKREYVSAAAFYAKSITIPEGYWTVRLPGIIPDETVFGGDTEAQAENVFGKIAASLKEAGAFEADVVAMTVYLASPTPGGNMDFDGMMRAYGRHYGSDAQPNRPVRSTVQVAGLVRPGILVEIEVTAAIPAWTLCQFEKNSVS